MIEKVKYVCNEEGGRESVVLPVQLYGRLLALPGAKEEIAAWEKGLRIKMNEGLYPEAVLDLVLTHNCTIQKAWRLYRNMKISEVAKLIDVFPNSLSMIETRKRIQRSTAQKLSAVYDCKPEQLYLD